MYSVSIRDLPRGEAEWRGDATDAADDERGIMNERGKPFSAADARKVAMVALVSQKSLTKNFGRRKLVELAYLPQATEEDQGAHPF
jgi:hypothetical protein